MRQVLQIIAANLISLSLIGVMFYMIVHNIDDWGWVLFAALCSMVTLKWSSYSTEEEDEE